MTTNGGRSRSIFLASILVLLTMTLVGSSAFAQGPRVASCAGVLASTAARAGMASQLAAGVRAAAGQMEVPVGELVRRAAQARGDLRTCLPLLD